jgi:hypothetical protein
MFGIFDGVKREFKQMVVDLGRGAEDFVYPPNDFTKLIIRPIQDKWRNKVEPELEKVGTTVQNFQKKEVEPKIEKIGETVQELWENNVPELEKVGTTVQKLWKNNVPELEKVGTTVQKLWKNNVPRKRSLDSPEDEYSTGESSTGESPTWSPRGKKQCISLYHNSNNNKETNGSLEGHKLDYCLIKQELLDDLLKTYEPKGGNNDDWG